MHFVMKHTDFFDLIKGARMKKDVVLRGKKNNLCFVVDVSILYTTDAG